ncbi:hypothetical protein [Bacteroides fluxus]|jgi:hypothetical protein|uniref:hypothetical protein n=1 Tax=Bacteroides fluxus TaxID=626930 RepID=UPI0026DB2FD3|nr:hypothetical protein [Bacteroides fluxus]MDY3790074.1 hypothetical protein [Bacteroides fluxus]
MNKRKKVASATTHPLNSHDKGNDFQSQYQIVYQSFKKHPKTMLDVSLETGILRANICRYVADMEDKELIQLLYKTEDEHTRSKAGYYTTDKTLFRKDNNQQLNLWEGE